MLTSRPRPLSLASFDPTPLDRSILPLEVMFIRPIPSRRAARSSFPDGAAIFMGEEHVFVMKGLVLARG